MQQATQLSCRATQLGRVVGLQQRPHSVRASRSRLQPGPFAQHSHRGTTAAAAPQAEAAASSGGSGLAAAASSTAAASTALLQRVLATCSLGDRGTLLLAAALAGGLLLGAAEPALAAHSAAAAPGDTRAPQLLADLAENEDFWGNVLRYISYFFSVLLGTAYIAIKPILELLKRPTTAVLVVAGLAGLFYFVSFTVQAMLGINEPLDYTASSIVTPMT